MPLLTSLPTPVLAIAPDAVRHLEGGDALSALWALFSKCSSSIHHGRRLENASWRLWHRQLQLAEAASKSAAEGNVGRVEAEDEKSAEEEEKWDEKAELSIDRKQQKMGSEDEKISTPSHEAQGYHDQYPAQSNTTTPNNNGSASTPASPTTPTPIVTSSGSLSKPDIRNISPSSSMPCSTSLAPRPSLRHTATDAQLWTSQPRRTHFLTLNGGTINVGQIICDLIPTDAKDEVEDLKRWNAKLAVFEARRQVKEEEGGGGDASDRSGSNPRSFLPSASQDATSLMTSSVSAAVLGSDELASLSTAVTMSTTTTTTTTVMPSSTRTTTMTGPATPRSALMIPEAKIGSPTPQSLNKPSCNSQLPTPRAEMGENEDSLFRLYPSTMTAAPIPTPTRTVISIDDVSTPHTPPDSEEGDCVPLPSTSTSTGGAGATSPSLGSSRGLAPPKLVIVNPTPGPTPQPTPPSTPLLEAQYNTPSKRAEHKQQENYLGVPSRSRRNIPREKGQKVVSEPEESTADGFGARGGGRDMMPMPPKLELEPSAMRPVEPGPPSGRLSPSESTRSDDSGLGSSIVSLPLPGEGVVVKQDTRARDGPVPFIPAPTTTTDADVRDEPTSPQDAHQQRQRQQPGGSQLATSVASVTSVASTKSAKSNKSTKSLGAAAGIGMTRRAASGKNKGGVKGRVNLGARSKSSASLGGSRSRSRGREDAGGVGVGLAAAAVGVMTAVLPALNAAAGSSMNVQEKPRRRSSGDILGRRRASGLAALTRTLSHEDVVEVTEEDEDEEEIVFDDESDIENDEELMRQEKIARQQEEDRIKHEQLLLRARYLEMEERRRAEMERRRMDGGMGHEVDEEEEEEMRMLEEENRRLEMEQAEMEEERESDMMPVQQHHSQQQREYLLRQQRKQQDRERREMEARMRIQQEALRAAEAEAEAEERAMRIAEARAAADERTRARLRASAGMVDKPRGTPARSKVGMFEFGSHSEDGSTSAGGVVSKASDGSSEKSAGKEDEANKAGPSQPRLVPLEPVSEVQLAPPPVVVEANKPADKSVPAPQVQVKEQKQVSATAKGKGKAPMKDKGKGKQREKSAPSSSAAAAAAMASLASPLLPQGNKWTIVLATDDSECTDTDESGDSWTSEGEESNEPPPPPPAKPASAQSQQRSQQQHQPVQNAHTRRPSNDSSSRAPPAEHHTRQNVHPQRIGLYRTHSSNATGQQHQRFMTKREQMNQARIAVERAAMQLRLEEQKAREMFAKKPTSSYQNLNKLAMTSADGKEGEKQEDVAPPRTKSALSILLNPDPSIFPENHPYRRGFSSGELTRPGPPSQVMGLAGMGAFGPLTSINPPRGDGPRPQMTPLQQPVPQQQQLAPQQELQQQQEQAQPQARVPVRKPDTLDRQMSERVVVREAEDQKRVREAEEQERARQRELQLAKQRQQQQAQRQRQRQPPQRRATEPPPQQQHHRQDSQASEVSQQQQQQPQQQQVSKANRQSSQQQFMPSVLPIGFRGAGLQMNKGAAAMPVESQVDIGPIAQLERPAQVVSPVRPSAEEGSVNRRGPHRLGGPPQGQELESESEDEVGNADGGNVLNMAMSLAEHKLRLFAQKTGIIRPPPPPPQQQQQLAAGHGRGGAGPTHADDVPPWARQPHQDLRRGAGPPPPPHVMSQPGPPSAPQPIPLMHPYDLPPPTAPTTPKTTRKLMLRTEMSESVRRNLIWQRQEARPIRRTVSAAGASGFPPRVPPLAASPSMVQLTLKVKKTEGAAEEVTQPPVKKNTPEELQARRRKILERNRSSGYHYSGW